MKEEELILYCLELAKKALYTAKPNPMVGAVIVVDNQIIAEGYHSACGQAHAEVMALNNVTDKNLLKRATLYVNLEPCNHYGRTPPCSNSIIESGIKKVVIGALDSNPLTAGKGIETLIKAGIEVVSGVCADQCRKLNKCFYTFHEKKRPYVILKWAETADGFIADSNYKSKWISNEESRNKVHTLRAELHAILIGKQTALYDNPQLDVRGLTSSNFANPIRIILDSNLSVPISHQLFNNTARVLVINSLENKQVDHISYIQHPKSKWSALEILEVLHQQGIISVLIEGGSQTLGTFLSDNLWDEIYRFVGPMKFKSGIPAPIVQTKANSIEQLGDNQLYFLERRL